MHTSNEKKIFKFKTVKQKQRELDLNGMLKASD